MGLLTDIAFAKALRSNAELLEELPAGDVYNVAIALPDRDVANAPVPYVIVGYEGMTNDETTKDNDFEGETDNATVTITVAAPTREKLGSLAVAIRQTVRAYFLEHYGDTTEEEHAEIPEDVTFSAGGVSYDPDKPCFWQVLNYQCQTPAD